MAVISNEGRFILMTPKTGQNNILVVDDNPDNLRLLAAMLSDRDYSVRKALSGQMALKTVETRQPDLILLDINMSGMNGYEVCQKLKLNEDTKHIPVIFISAMDDVLDKVKAFEVGGVDYITKPLQAEEVIARIENQLTIWRQKQQLEMEILERKKAEESLQLYLHAVSHDLKNPVIAMSIILSNLQKKGREREKEISVPLSLLKQMEESCDRQLHLINSLIETRQNEIWGVSLDWQFFSLHELIEKMTHEWQLQLERHEAKLVNNIPVELPRVKGDYYQILRVWENLLANALKYNSPGITITLEAKPLESGRVYCSVRDNGIGISEEQLDHLFQRYQRGNGRGKSLGLGLGLYLCRQIVNAHGGEIGVDSHPYEGSRFWFTLPTD
ncbi:MAG: Sensor histidine kinase RcsC [Chroococcopsis gigantea SAG 12.99]|nr:Sensor histidine kinase RcsC [Chroococcopsis gigantea SAG 12.99]